MVTIQTHRAAMESYFVKAHFLSSKGKGNILLYDKKCESRAIKGGFIKMFGHLNLKMILVVICVRLIIQAIITLSISIDTAPLTVLFCNYPVFFNCPLADLQLLAVKRY